MKTSIKYGAKLMTAAALLSGIHANVNAQQVEWVSTTATQKWQVQKATSVAASGNADAEVFTSKPHQTMEGFGACFNEQGWTSLSALSQADQDHVFQELFVPGKGANFTVFRMPIGANDFARKWYSFNENEGDFKMKKFSISNDKETLIPFIKSALRYNPALKLWASPWSPPSWMKTNKHYASKAFPTNGITSWRDLRFDFAGLNNGIKPEQERTSGSDMFIQEPEYLKAYALYFSKFIQAYKKEGINISMVMPQNEFKSAQNFPSATWTAKGLSNFISYLGPEMNKLGVDVFLGTVEKGDPSLVDTVLTSPQSAKYVKGAGFQWDGKMAIDDIHKRYPNLTLYQTEQECGNGLNDWAYCKYSWTLMEHYLKNGVSTYDYWNLSLPDGGKGNWGWYQNSLITVNESAKTYAYTNEYYLMKHFSHYVLPGAKYVETSGLDKNIIAFENPDHSVAVLVHHEGATDKVVHIKVGGTSIAPLLKADSFNTFLIK